jgi:hypothetical protein
LRFLLRKVEALLKSERNSDTDSRSKAYNYNLTSAAIVGLFVG